MSLIRMGTDSDTVRCLDEVDLTLTLDSQSSNREQLLNIEVSAKPIVFRMSYRDIMLITAISTKAAQLYGKSQGVNPGEEFRPSKAPTTAPISTQLRSTNAPGKARVMTTKEQVRNFFIPSAAIYRI